MEQGSATILVVDDNEAGRYVTSKILRKAGFEVVEAENGRKALEKSLLLPDLIILDINLPDINGFEVCKKIKQDSSTMHIPVLHISATTIKPKTFSPGFDDGADGFLMQPVDPAELTATINALLRLKQAESSLKISEMKFRTALQSLGEAVFSVNTQGNVDIYNDAFLHLLNTQPERVNRAFISDILSFSDSENNGSRKNPAFEAMNKNEVIRLENILLRREDGPGYYVTLNSAPIHNEKNEVTGAITVITDITNEMKLQKALIDSAQHYKTLANSGQALIRTSGLQGGCDYLNEIWLRFTGKNLEESLGWGWLSSVHRDDQENLGKVLIEAAESQSPARLEYRLLKATNEYRWILDETSPRFDSNGVFIGFISHCLDITERIASLNEIRRLNAELEERVKQRTLQLEVSNKELEAFSYSVSHDLRAPLRALNGYTEMLISKCSDGQVDEAHLYGGKILAASRRMWDLIEGLLNLAKVTRQSIEIRDVDLTSLANSVICGICDRDSQRKVEVKIEAGMMARGDSNLIRIVLENLLENAVKFSSKKEVSQVEIGIHSLRPSKVFYVKDNGAGFDMAYADKLFAPFQRLHGSNEFAGTGIGLATVQRIILKHGGRIWVKAEQDKGATFFFTLGA